LVNIIIMKNKKAIYVMKKLWDNLVLGKRFFRKH